MSGAGPKRPLRSWATKPPEAYLAALHDDNPRVRQQALAALEVLGHKAAARAILPLLDDEVEAVRLTAVRTLATLGDKRTMPALVATLKDPSERVRAALIEALQRRGALDLCRTPEGVDALIAALPTSQILRYSAARALGAIREPRAILPLVEALRLEIANAPPATQWGDAIAISLGMHGAAAVPVLLPLLADQSSEVRRLGALALGYTGDSAVIEPLRRLLQDDDERVRAQAREVLRWLDET